MRKSVGKIAARYSCGYGILHSWLYSLGAPKAAGAVGLLIGIGVPLIGVSASVGLVGYFIGAIITVVHA